MMRKSWLRALQPDGGVQQQLLFTVGNASDRTAKNIIAAVTHFDKHPGLSITNDKVEFAAVQRNFWPSKSKMSAF